MPSLSVAAVTATVRCDWGCRSKLFPAGFAALANIAMAGFYSVEIRTISHARLMELLCAVVVVCVYAVSFDHRVDIVFFSFDPSEWYLYTACACCLVHADWSPC